MTEGFSKAKHVDLWVRDLKPHPTVQREFRAAWARELRDKFDPDDFGELIVIRTEDASYYVIDGQHRLWAAREWGGENQRVPCRVYEGISEARAAAMFLGLNTSKSVRSIDKFLQAVKAGFKDEVCINKIVTSIGLRVGGNYSPGVIRGSSALESVFKRWGGDVLLRALLICRAAWGKEAEAFDGVVIRSVACLLHHFPDDIDDNELSRKLTRQGGASRLVGAARDHSKTMGIAVERAGAEWLLNLYNKARRTKLLSLAEAEQSISRRKKSADQ